MALPLKTANPAQLYTANEFMTLAFDPGKRYELVRGVIKEMSAPGEQHTLIGSNLLRALVVHVEINRLGRVLPPGGFELNIPGATQDTIRTPDLTFMAKGKLTGQAGAIKAVPDLAVEIYSPNDRPGELHEKLEDYQAAGWNLVWVIYPTTATPRHKAGTVEVYQLGQSLEPTRIFQVGEQLSGQEVLPGFSMPVEALFDYQD